MRGIIFDLDGTLIDTAEDIAIALNRALADEKLPTYSISGVVAMVGNGARRLIADAVGNQDVETLDRVYDRYREHYRQVLTLNSRAYEGIHALLRELNRRDIPISVLTNKPESDAQEIIKRIFEDIVFATVTGGRESVPVKPDIRAGEYVTKVTGIPLADMMMVGDGKADIKFAQNAGMTMVAVSWGFSSREQLINAGATTIVDNANDILTIFDKLSK